MDLRALFTLSADPLELLVRGTAVYWFLFLLFRFVLRRDIGSIGLADVVLVVLIADASQNAMAGSHESVADGALLVATIAGWNLLVDWLAYRSALLRRLLEPRPLPLVRDGVPVRANMRREMITLAELEAKLREFGVEDLALVKRATMESDGTVTVIRRDGAEPGSTPAAPQGAAPQGGH